MPQTILVIDDKANMRILLHEYLSEQGFRVTTADNGRNGLFAARREKPDLILLDVMMPEMDGYQFLTEYRREHETPVIVITAKEEETDAVLGLELGADDYVVKPVRMRELLSRVRAVLRRTQSAQATEDRLEAGELVLDRKRVAVTLRGAPVSLTPTEFNLLALMMASPGQAFPRELLLDRLSDDGYTGLEKTINVHVRNLRTKIELDPANPTYIETVFGVGYRFAKHESPKNESLKKKSP